MLDPTLSAFGLLIFLGTTAICYFILKKAHRLGLIDKPNERSSHQIPTPRGAGISFALVISGVVVGYSFISQDLKLLPYWLVPIGMALLGFFDDFLNLPAKFKFIIQILLATVFSTLIFSQTSIFSLPSLSLGIFYILFIMWLTNLFNFMDGIDGIAGAQGFISATAFFILLPADTLMHDFAFFLALGCIGFLIFNWHPAKVFMGDVGSCFIGSSLAVLAVFSQQNTPFSIIFYAMFMGPFIVDATYTLLTRGLTKQKVMSAHRSHLYQKLVNVHGYKASQVCLIYIAINILLFFPLAWISRDQSWWVQMIAFVIASLPQLLLSVKLKAGLPPQENSL